MRKSFRLQSGMYLVEMVVSVALSGLFVILLSGLLSETLALSSASQGELLAATAAELLIENAKDTPYAVLLAASNGNTNYTLQMNNSSTGQTIRSAPVQLDLTNVVGTSVYGAVDAHQGVINLSNQWTTITGNFFKGTATETIQNASALTGLPSLQVTVVINYTGSYASQSNSPAQKTLTRTAFIFQDGANFQ